MTTTERTVREVCGLKKGSRHPQLERDSLCPRCYDVTTNIDNLQKVLSGGYRLDVTLEMLRSSAEAVLCRICSLALLAVFPTDLDRAWIACENKYPSIRITVSAILQQEDKRISPVDIAMFKISICVAPPHTHLGRDFSFHAHTSYAEPGPTG